MSRFHPALLALSLGLVLHTLPAAAGPQADALGQCFVNSTTPEEKATISRWLFIVLAQQPEVRDLATIPDASQQETDRAMARLVERMVTDACRSPAQQALAQEGPNAIKQSVTIFAQASARKTFADPAVASAVNGFTRYLDMGRIIQSFLTIQLGR
ncbi:MAG: hypothetical protein H6R19_147 [Proteobacteria bacterium]|nr:hypothetical protein [Pseudomonadota bacterium]